MEKQNQIHLSLDTLAAILAEGKDLHEKTPNTIPVVRITKTAFRQTPDTEDKVEYSLLKTADIHENVESHGV